MSFAMNSISNEKSFIKTTHMVKLLSLDRKTEGSEDGERYTEYVYEIIFKYLGEDRDKDLSYSSADSRDKMLEKLLSAGNSWVEVDREGLVEG